MSLLVADCPRCDAEKITFDLKHEQLSKWVNYGWQLTSEVFCICRNCDQATIFKLLQSEPSYREFFIERKLKSFNGSVNKIGTVDGFVCISDINKMQPPLHLPENLRKAFTEGAACHAIQCYNAAGTMFRLCVDLATQPLLPTEVTEGLNSKTRRDLGLRLPWLFKAGLLPEDLSNLSTCIKEDGNDGAHRGTLEREDAEDICDFTFELLERLYTEPKRIELAEARRSARRITDG